MKKASIETRLFVISAPSGAGKTTLVRALLANDPNITFSVSFTTRSARPGEQDGEDYFFVDVSRFEQMVVAQEFLEHAKVFDNYYGTAKDQVRQQLALGKHVILEIDWQGAQQIAKSDLKDHVLSIFILPPSITELHRRLIGRGQDDETVIEERMQKSWDEISHWDGYDYVLINDDLDETEERLKTIIAAERLRASQQPGLMDHVRGLQQEFEER